MEKYFLQNGQVGLYLIIPISTTYLPSPMMGGIATAKENSQINCTYLDVRQVTCVVTCHDRSCHITDVNRIAAIAVRVYRELIPKMYMRIRKVMGMPKVD